jgi:hypothetical protein
LDRAPCSLVDLVARGLQFGLHVAGHLVDKQVSVVVVALDRCRAPWTRAAERRLSLSASRHAALAMRSRDTVGVSANAT